MNLRRTMYRISAVGVCLAVALGYWTLAEAGVLTPPNGIVIDAKGELTLRQADDPTGQKLLALVRDARVSRSEWMLPRFVPGAGGRLAAFLRRGERSPRLAFAGDYLVGTNAEAAVTSGMRAAVALEAQLSGARSGHPAASSAPLMRAG